MQEAFQEALKRQAEGRKAWRAERADRVEDIREDFRRREDRPRTAIGPPGAPEYRTASVSFTNSIRVSSAGAVFQREIKLKRGRHRVTDTFAGDTPRRAGRAPIL